MVRHRLPWNVDQFTTFKQVSSEAVSENVRAYRLCDACAQSGNRDHVCGASGVYVPIRFFTLEQKMLGLILQIILPESGKGGGRQNGVAITLALAKDMHYHPAAVNIGHLKSAAFRKAQPR